MAVEAVGSVLTGIPEFHSVLPELDPFIHVVDGRDDRDRSEVQYLVDHRIKSGDDEFGKLAGEPAPQPIQRRRQQALR